MVEPTGVNRKLALMAEQIQNTPEINQSAPGFETWQWVNALAGLEGLKPYYEVSNLGRMRSWADYEGRADNKGSRVWKPPKLLTGSLMQGYPHVNLRMKDGRAKSIHIHSIVALAFLGPRPPGASVRHLNDVKTDNRAKNLSYGTHLENALDRVKNRKAQGKLSEAEVSLIRMRARNGETYTDIARDLGCTVGTVRRTALGMSYAYLNEKYAPELGKRRSQYSVGDCAQFNLADDLKGFVIKSHAEGLRPLEISLVCGEHESTIRGFLQASGLIHRTSLSDTSSESHEGDEIWRPLSSRFLEKHKIDKFRFGGRYEVSSTGKVKSWARPSAVLLAPQVGKQGYIYYMFSFDGRQLFCKAHQLVAWTYLGPPPERADRVRHLDGDEKNNDYKNLAWGDVLSNTRDIHPDHRGRRTPERARLEESALQLKKKGLSKKEIAESLGVKPRDASRLIKKAELRQFEKIEQMFDRRITKFISKK